MVVIGELFVIFNCDIVLQCGTGDWRPAESVTEVMCFVACGFLM